LHDYLNVPELPDITVYLEALERRVLDQTLESVAIASPFLLRTASPPVSSVEGHGVIQLKRLGKRICIGFENDHWLVLHLMIAGRLHWSTQKKKMFRGLARFDFSSGCLQLTEAGTQKRASLHVMESEAAMDALDPGGLDVFSIDLEAFKEVLASTNHTLKRALTDPRRLSGIGNAYSDEILWESRLSPIALTQKLTDEEFKRLFEGTSKTLSEWVERLRVETGDAFPEKVTAFRRGMAVHGRYREPCPRCGAKVQRIRYATNETNYCPNCQTGGKLLADRALSRILKTDWPRTAEELG